MFDAALRPHLDPIVDRLAASMDQRAISADRVTLGGFAIGLAAIAATALGAPLLGLGLFLLNRIADGLDGAIARRRGVTDRGGYLDITLDFLIYSGMVFGHACADPAQNALAATFLVWSFVGTGASFLAYATIAAKKNMETTIRGKKSLYYLGGLTEGFETILCFVLMGLFPAFFPNFAWIFGSLCWLTTTTRVYAGWRDFA